MVHFTLLITVFAQLRGSIQQSCLHEWREGPRLALVPASYLPKHRPHK